jgi:adenosine deaminase
MLKTFEIFLPLVRGNLELLEQLAMDFVKRQAQQHIIYTEMRYSPHLLAAGASLSGNRPVRADPIVDAITRGLRRGEQEYDVKVRVQTHHHIYTCIPACMHVVCVSLLGFVLDRV